MSFFSLFRGSTDKKNCSDTCSVRKVTIKAEKQFLSHGHDLGLFCVFIVYPSHSLFVEEDSDDDADDEDHSQDRSDYPDQTIACVKGLGV